MTCRTFGVICVLCLLCTGCYSLKGISIPPTITTFYVDQFQGGAGNAPPDIGQRFSEELKDRVLRNSRLDFDEGTPDIEFTGSVTTFNVQSVAPERRTDGGGATEFGSSLNRLTIAIQVDYVNNQDDEDNWSQSFSFFQDFDNMTNLSDVQDDLIETILSQISTDIFNKSFTNW